MDTTSIMCTLNETLKKAGENAKGNIQVAEMKAEIAKVAARYYAPYRHALISELFKGASKDELKAELAAFDADTKNGTQLVIIAANTRTNDKGKLTDDEGNILENAVSFATVISTNKDGEITRKRQVFRVPYIADTDQRNNRIVAYWLQFRETREESFAAARSAKVDTLKKELAPLAAQVETFEKYNVPVPAELSEKVEILKAELAKLGAE